MVGSGAIRLRTGVSSAVKSAPTILFVDDSPVARRLFTRLLKTRGYKVTGAADAREALALFSKENFDVVIADLHLKSELDGIDVLREIEKVRPNKGKILLTATDPKDVESSVQALGGACITKPVTLKNSLPAFGHSPPVLDEVALFSAAEYTKHWVAILLDSAK